MAGRWPVSDPDRVPSREMCGHLPAVGSRAVLEEIDPLPPSELHPAAADRDRQRHRQQGGADMRGHVVGALERVGEPVHALGHQPPEEALRSTCTSGSAFSWIRSEQEVWRTKSVSRPSAASLRSSQSATGRVISVRPGPRVSKQKTVCARPLTRCDRRQRHHAHRSVAAARWWCRVPSAIPCSH